MLAFPSAVDQLGTQCPDTLSGSSSYASSGANSPPSSARTSLQPHSRGRRVEFGRDLRSCVVPPSARSRFARLLPAPRAFRRGWVPPANRRQNLRLDECVELGHAIAFSSADHPEPVLDALIPFLEAQGLELAPASPAVAGASSARTPVRARSRQRSARLSARGCASAARPTWCPANSSTRGTQLSASSARPSRSVAFPRPGRAFALRLPTDAALPSHHSLGESTTSSVARGIP
jgi:hypothetical protein